MIDEKELIEELKHMMGHYFRDGLYVNLKAVLRIVQSQPPADQWIPCSERLPVYYDWHHVTVKPFYEGRGNYVAVERYDRIKGEWSFHERAYKDKIIAWKPKPEPYEGVE